MSKKSLQQQWQEVCNDYLRAFCKRHEYAYDPKDWIGIGAENIGTIVEVNDMYINMDDLRYDVDNNVPADKFAKWYDKQLELHELGIEVWLNYPNYCKGAPDEWTEERMEELRAANQRLWEMKEQLEEMCKDYKKKKTTMF